MKMKNFFLLIVTVLSFSAHAQVDELIYQPKVLSPELKSELDVEEYKWRLGLKIGQMLAENSASSSKFGVSANYLVWDQWYASAQIDLNEWQITPNTTDSAMAWSLGAGYSMLQGAAYITDGLTLPWQMYLQLDVGEQTLRQKSSTFASGAIGWQLSNDKNYAALEWRHFQTNDDRLKQLDSDKGYEWSIIFGRYF
jgi:hypothetical protein